MTDFDYQLEQMVVGLSLCANALCVRPMTTGTLIEAHGTLVEIKAALEALRAGLAEREPVNQQLLGAAREAHRLLDSIDDSNGLAPKAKAVLVTLGAAIGAAEQPEHGHRILAKAQEIKREQVGLGDRGEQLAPAEEMRRVIR